MPALHGRRQVAADTAHPLCEGVDRCEQPSLQIAKRFLAVLVFAYRGGEDLVEIEIAEEVGFRQFLAIGAKARRVEQSTERWRRSQANALGGRACGPWVCSFYSSVDRAFTSVPR
jgi:hypothetical protein